MKLGLAIAALVCGILAIVLNNARVAGAACVLTSAALFMPEK